VDAGVCGYSWGSLGEKRRPTVETAIYLLLVLLKHRSQTPESSSAWDGLTKTCASQLKRNILLFIRTKPDPFHHCHSLSVLSHHSRQCGICNRVVPEALQRDVFLLVWVLSIKSSFFLLQMWFFFSSSFSYVRVFRWSVKWNSENFPKIDCLWELKKKNIPTLYHTTIMCVRAVFPKLFFWWPTF